MLLSQLLLAYLSEMSLPLLKQWLIMWVTMDHDGLINGSFGIQAPGEAVVHASQNPFPVKGLKKGSHGASGVGFFVHPCRSLVHPFWGVPERLFPGMHLPLNWVVSLDELARTPSCCTSKKLLVTEVIGSG